MWAPPLSLVGGFPSLLRPDPGGASRPVEPTGLKPAEVLAPSRYSEGNFLRFLVKTSALDTDPICVHRCHFKVGVDGARRPAFARSVIRFKEILCQTLSPTARSNSSAHGNPTCFYLCHRRDHRQNMSVNKPTGQRRQERMSNLLYPPRTGSACLPSRSKMPPSRDRCLTGEGGRVLPGGAEEKPHPRCVQVPPSRQSQGTRHAAAFPTSRAKRTQGTGRPQSQWASFP